MRFFSFQNDLRKEKKVGFLKKLGGKKNQEEKEEEKTRKAQSAGSPRRDVPRPRRRPALQRRRKKILPFFFEPKSFEKLCGKNFLPKPKGTTPGALFKGSQSVVTVFKREKRLKATRETFSPNKLYKNHARDAALGPARGGVAVDFVPHEQRLFLKTALLFHNFCEPLSFQERAFFETHQLCGSLSPLYRKLESSTSWRFVL